METRGGQGPSDMLKDELTQSLEELEALLKAKDEVNVMSLVLCEHTAQTDTLILPVTDQFLNAR